MRNTGFLLTLLTAIAAITGCVAVPADPPSDPAAGPPPLLTITSPARLTTVSNIVTVSSIVSSAVGTTRVQFDFPDGTSATDTAPPFTVAWNSTSVPDGPHEIHAVASDDLGDAGTDSVPILVANAPCLGTFVAAGLPLRIPDQAGTTAQITIANNAIVTSLALSLRIAHEFPEDLRIELISPTGARYPINTTSGPGGLGVVIDNQIVPVSSGQRATGTWTLGVWDELPGDEGRLDAWSLSITGQCGSAP